MDRVKLNLDPEASITFDREVDIPTPDGKPLKVCFTFKHRTREQVAEMLDAYASRGVKPEGGEVNDGRDTNAMRSAAEMVREAMRRDLEIVLDIATGWNVEHEFNATNVARFLGKYAGAAGAIATDYRVSLFEGRLGN